MSDTDSRQDTPELIAFRIGAQEFCLDIMSVREIRGWTEATPLPHSPSYVRGVINLRGAVLPIVDLKERLSLGLSTPSDRSVIIVVHIGRRLVGLLVDAVSDILAVPREAIQPTPNVGCASVSRFVRNIITLQDRMVSWVTLDDIAPEQDELQAA